MAVAKRGLLRHFVPRNDIRPTKADMLAPDIEFAYNLKKWQTTRKNYEISD